MISLKLWLRHRTNVLIKCGNMSWGNYWKSLIHNGLLDGVFSRMISPSCRANILTSAIKFCGYTQKTRNFIVENLHKHDFWDWCRKNLTCWRYFLVREFRKAISIIFCRHILNKILGIDDFVIPLLLSNPSELTGADKLQVFAWLNKGRSMDPNVIRLLLGETTGDMDLREMYLGIGDIFISLVPNYFQWIFTLQHQFHLYKMNMYVLNQNFLNRIKIWCCKVPTFGITFDQNLSAVV